MQMYRVKFKHHKDKVIDTGEALVVASNADQACDMVATLLELPRSSTSMEANREKPSMYVLERWDVHKHTPTRATFPAKGEDTRHQYNVSASALVWAHSENAAMRKLAAAINAEVEGGDKAKAVGSLQILCDRSDHSPKPSAIEANSVFTNMKMFQGGAVRPR